MLRCLAPASTLDSSSSLFCRLGPRLLAPSSMPPPRVLPLVNAASTPAPPLLPALLLLLLHPCLCCCLAYALTPAPLCSAASAPGSQLLSMPPPRVQLFSSLHSSTANPSTASYDHPPSPTASYSERMRPSTANALATPRCTNSYPPAEHPPASPRIRTPPGRIPKEHHQPSCILMYVRPRHPNARLAPSTALFPPGVRHPSASCASDAGARNRAVPVRRAINRADPWHKTPS